jgi:hypothetical protein
LALPVQRDDDQQARTGLRAALEIEPAAQQVNALVDARQAIVSGRDIIGPEAAAVINYDQVQIAGSGCQFYPHLPGGGMLLDVGQRFLSDAIDGHF